jgi:hypothetical protein
MRPPLREQRNLPESQEGRRRGIPPLRTERARMGHPRSRFSLKKSKAKSVAEKTTHFLGQGGRIDGL